MFYKTYGMCGCVSHYILMVSYFFLICYDKWLDKLLLIRLNSEIEKERETERLRRKKNSYQNLISNRYSVIKVEKNGDTLVKMSAGKFMDHAKII